MYTKNVLLLPLLIRKIRFSRQNDIKPILWCLFLLWDFEKMVEAEKQDCERVVSFFFVSEILNPPTKDKDYVFVSI